MTIPRPKLSIRDLRDFRDATGFAPDQVPDNTVDQAIAGAALLWLYRRKAEPSLTFDQVCDLDGEQVGEQMAAYADDDDEEVPDDPLPGGAPGEGPPPPREGAGSGFSTTPA